MFRGIKNMTNVCSLSWCLVQLWIAFSSLALGTAYPGPDAFPSPSMLALFRMAAPTASKLAPMVKRGAATEVSVALGGLGLLDEMDNSRKAFSS
ncbi:hypothetical protein ASPACDRAFT_111530 [Aspergillus aculeatus ATCC 16872]|uniref:Secreted protein n=1 Tax=Aspergillus aculeatus (strain ATCC 16872 / CBS 172.66 / WB 5094) TaxID=690307 RepID=A0A1L9X5D3_ASPA1|nr:uncharacterized protein ASPACDRAFT_111530 [Aspergillus aculeatus ATCC 16872]OJK03657.1 hypothetical protein ASPACDRAFT_111530 [Aspergillus aculeatus ATCC 16872]